MGREVLVDQSENGVERLLTGFILSERGIARHGHQVRTESGEGVVTSGNISPLLETGVGLAYVSPPPGTDSDLLEVEIRGKWIPGRIAKPPFHKA